MAKANKKLLVPSESGTGKSDGEMDVRMKDLRKEGKTFKEIADTLNSEGFKNKRGKKILPVTVGFHLRGTGSTRGTRVGKRISTTGPRLAAIRAVIDIDGNEDEILGIVKSILD